MNDIWVDEYGEVMINPNVDVIHLPPEIFEEFQKIVSEEIDKEILRELSMKVEHLTHTEKE